MAVTDTDKVDFVSTSPETGGITLMISDHLPWDEEGLHAEILSDKLTGYLASIQSGEVVRKYPQAEGKSLKIDIVCKFDPPAEIVEYLGKVSDSINEEFGVEVTWRRH